MSDAGLDPILFNALSKERAGVFSADMTDPDLNLALDAACRRARLTLALSMPRIEVEFEEPDLPRTDDVIGEVIFN